MRHKYATPAIVLARTPLSEAGALATLLTSEFGLVRARAEGVRRPGAKLAHALQTFDESEVSLVRGKDGWRLTGAILSFDHFHALPAASRTRAARVSALLLRLVHGESDTADEASLYGNFRDFLSSLPALPEEEQDAAEVLVALRLLGALGLDSGSLPPEGYGEDARADALLNRSAYISRINRGIAASGL